jgi:hypothetical protein
MHGEELRHGLIDVTVPVAIATAAAIGGIIAAAVLSTQVHAAELVTVDSAAGPITVSPRFAAKIVPFIADVVARGFKGHVHCYSWAKSHRPHSLHHTGDACDFAQHWPKGGGHIVTNPVMYRVGDLTRLYGLRNGCSFNDCGHIDFGRPVLAARRKTHRTRTAEPTP